MVQGLVKSLHIHDFKDTDRLSDNYIESYRRHTVSSLSSASSTKSSKYNHFKKFDSSVGQTELLKTPKRAESFSHASVYKISRGTIKIDLHKSQIKVIPNELDDIKDTSSELSSDKIIEEENVEQKSLSRRSTKTASHISQDFSSKVSRKLTSAYFKPSDPQIQNNDLISENTDLIRSRAGSRASSVRSFKSYSTKTTINTQYNDTKRNLVLSAAQKSASTPIKSCLSKRLSRSSSSAVYTGDFGLNDLCSQPKSHHLTAMLSTDAQYAMIKVYEDMMYQELATLVPDIEQIPRISSARFSTCSSMRNSSHSISSTEYQRVKIENDNEEKERRKVKVSHFIEGAMKILDAIQSSKRSKDRREKPASAPLIGRTLPTINEPVDDEELFEMYSRWVFLWNKFLDEY